MEMDIRGQTIKFLEEKRRKKLCSWFMQRFFTQDTKFGLDKN